MNKLTSILICMLALISLIMSMILKTDISWWASTILSFMLLMTDILQREIRNIDVEDLTDRVIESLHKRIDEELERRK